MPLLSGSLDPTPEGQRAGCFVVLAALVVGAAVIAVVAFGVRAATQHPTPKPSTSSTQRSHR